MDSAQGFQNLRYVPPPVGECPPKYLVANAGSVLEQRFVFYERIEIGRDHEGRTVLPGLLLIPDETISRRHCVITQMPDGKCYVHDVSRNGTRIEKLRLVPNVETELPEGQTLTVGLHFELLLAGDSASQLGAGLAGGVTASVPGYTVATVLVGDIRDYTRLVRTASSASLQKSVSRVFDVLTTELQKYGGTMKEYQGDAIFAFWEGALDPKQVLSACRAALALDALSRKIAGDTSVWDVPALPLKLDWALTTGPVVIDTFGGDRPTGLSVIGEAVVRAFRIEKFADDDSGSILACALTQEIAAEHFKFRDLGEKQAKGFDEPEHIFSLIEPA